MTAGKELTMTDIKKKVENRVPLTYTKGEGVDLLDALNPPVIEEQVIEPIGGIGKYSNPSFSDFQNDFANTLLSQPNIQDAVYRTYAVCVVILNDLKLQNHPDVELGGVDSLALMHRTIMEMLKLKAESEMNHE